MSLGKCPYCGGAVVSQKLTIQGQKVNLYTCEHAKKERNINDDYVFSSDASCRFRVYSNTFCAGINEASVNILNTSSLPPIRCEYIVGYGSGLIFTCKELSEVSKRKVHRNRAVFG